MKNKIYMTIANIYNELKNAIGSKSSLKEAIIDEVDNSKEVVRARADFNELNSRLIDIDDKISLNRIDKDSIDEKLHLLDSKIPKRTVGIIEDKYRSIAIDKGEVCNIKSHEIQVNKGETVELNIGEDSVVVDAKVREFGRFLKVGEPPSDGMSTGIGTDTKSNHIQISESNTSYDNNDFVISNDCISFKSLNKSDAIFNIVESYNNSILTVNDVINITSTSGKVYKNMFTSIGQTFKEKEFSIVLENTVPVFFKKLQYNLFSDYFESRVEVTYSDGSVVKTNVFLSEKVEVSFSDNKSVTKVAINIKNKGIKDIKMTYLGIDVDSNVSKNCSFEVNEQGIYNIKKSINLNMPVISSAVDLKLVALKDGKAFTFIPKTIKLTPSDFAYVSGGRCINNVIKPSYKVNRNLRKKFSINNDFEGESNIVTGAVGFGDYDVVVNEGFKLGNIIYSIRMIVKGEQITFKVPKDMRFEMLYSEDCVISGSIEALGHESVIVQMNSSCDIDKVEIDCWCPHNVEGNKEMWLNFSNVCSSVKYFNSSSKFEIDNISGSHNLIRNSINEVEAVAVDSDWNCKFNSYIYGITENNENREVCTSYDDRGFNIITYSFKNCGKAAAIFVSNDNYNSFYERLEETISIVEDNSSYAIIDRMEIVAKKHIGGSSVITSINGVEDAGTTEYRISFTGVDYFGYDFVKSTWVKDKPMFLKDLERLNDTMFSGIRFHSSYIFIKVKFNERDSSILSLNINLAQDSMIEVQEYEVYDKGISTNDIDKIDYNKLIGADNFKVLIGGISYSPYVNFKLQGFNLETNPYNRYININEANVEVRYIGDGAMSFTNNETEVDRIYVKLEISSKNNSLALDLNKENYSLAISNIQEQNLIINHNIRNLMDSVSDIMTTLAGESGASYIRDFMINSYKRISCGEIQSENIFKIENVKSIMGVSVWENILGNSEYNKKLRYNNQVMKYYEYSDIFFNLSSISLGRGYDTSAKRHSIVQSKVKTVGNTMKSLSGLDGANLSGWDNRTTPPWYCYYVYSPRYANIKLSKSNPICNFTYDFTEVTYVESVRDFQFGVQREPYDTGKNTDHAEAANQYTSISISNDGKYFHTVWGKSGSSLHGTGESFNGSSYRYGADYHISVSLKKYARYIRFTIEPYKISDLDKGEVRASFSSFKLYTGKKNIQPSGYIYNKVPIDTSNWKSILSIKVNSRLDSVHDVRLRFSNDEMESWYHYNENWINTTSGLDSFDEYVSAGKLETLSSDSLSELIGTGKLQIALALLTKNDQTSPEVFDVDITYTTTDGTKRTITANPHDYQLEFFEDTEELFVKNTSPVNKNFDILLS